MATEYRVTEGPSKYDLMLALFDDRCNRVEFHLQDKGRYFARVSSVSRHANGNLYWDISGELLSLPSNHHAGWYEGTYSTVGRKGNIRVRWTHEG